MRKRLIILITLAAVGALLLAGAVLAEDGLLFRRNISKTPDAETEKAAATAPTTVNRLPDLGNTSMV